MRAVTFPGKVLFRDVNGSLRGAQDRERIRPSIKAMGFFCSRSAALRPSKPKTGLLGAAAREPPPRHAKRASGTPACGARKGCSEAFFRHDFAALDSLLSSARSALLRASLRRKETSLCAVLYGPTEVVP